MNLIIRDKDLKPGCADIAIEDMKLSLLTSIAYRAALEADIVILMRMDAPTVKVLKDNLSPDQLAANCIFPNSAHVIQLLVMFGVAGVLDHRFVGQPCEWPSEETLRCCADLCQHCAAGDIPKQSSAFGAGIVIIHQFVKLDPAWAPCAAEKIWRRVYNLLNAESVGPERDVHQDHGTEKLSEDQHPR